MGPGRALFSSCRKGFTAFRPRLFRRPWTKYGQSGANERRAASEPCCAGPSDGASGSAVVGVGPDAGLIAGAASGRSVGFGACLTIEAVSLPCF